MPMQIMKTEANYHGHFHHYYGDFENHLMEISRSIFNDLSHAERLTLDLQSLMEAEIEEAVEIPDGFANYATDQSLEVINEHLWSYTGELVDAFSIDTDLAVYVAENGIDKTIVDIAELKEGRAISGQAHDMIRDGIEAILTA